MIASASYIRGVRYLEALSREEVLYA